MIEELDEPMVQSLMVLKTELEPPEEFRADSARQGGRQSSHQNGPSISQNGTLAGATRVPLRNVGFKPLAPLAPIRTLQWSLCDVCQCDVSVVFYLGTAKLGLCCYARNLVQECRDG